MLTVVAQQVVDNLGKAVAEEANADRADNGKPQRFYDSVVEDASRIILLTARALIHEEMTGTPYALRYASWPICSGTSAVCQIETKTNNLWYFIHYTV